MRQEWHQIRNPGLELGSQTSNLAEAETLGLDRWRTLPRAQMPPWGDPDEVAQVCGVLSGVPPIVAPYEVDELRARLALVCEGRAFVLQGGDCAETFSDNTESHLIANARTWAAAWPTCTRYTTGTRASSSPPRPASDTRPSPGRSTVPSPSSARAG